MDGANTSFEERSIVIAALAFFVAALLLHPSQVQGQQALITAPSSDQTPEGRGFFMHESQVVPWNGSSQGWVSTWFLTYGLTDHIELAATAYNVGYPLTGRSNLALGFKSSFPLFHEEIPLDLQLVSGAMLLVPFERGSVGHWIYSMLTFVIPEIDLRLGGGVMSATDYFWGSASGDHTGFFGTFELPIPGAHEFVLLAEWFSGSFAISNLIVGASYHRHEEYLIVLGWKIPTSDQHFYFEEQGLVFEVGFFFG